MTVLAIGVGNAILAWIAIIVALAGALAAVALLTRVVQPAREIERYAADVRDVAVAIGTNLDGVEELERTQELARAVPGLATAYLERTARG